MAASSARTRSSHSASSRWAGLPGSPLRPRERIDVMQVFGARLATRVLAPPRRDEAGTVELDLVRAARQRTNDVRELRDLAIVVERVPVGGECRDPPRVGARGELALGVDHGVELHRHARVEARPLAVDALHLHVQPQVPVDVRVERARPAVLQLDDLEPARCLRGCMPPCPRRAFSSRCHSVMVRSRMRSCSASNSAASSGSSRAATLYDFGKLIVPSRSRSALSVQCGLPRCVPVLRILTLDPMAKLTGVEGVASDRTRRRR